MKSRTEKEKYYEIKYKFDNTQRRINMKIANFLYMNILERTEIVLALVAGLSGCGDPANNTGQIVSRTATRAQVITTMNEPYCPSEFNGMQMSIPGKCPGKSLGFPAIISGKEVTTK